MKKTKLIYDPILDNDENLQKQADFYDKKDITEFDSQDIEIQNAELKKINILIPKDMYFKAKKIAAKAGIGYQSVLKLAITKGLNQLL